MKAVTPSPHRFFLRASDAAVSALSLALLWSGGCAASPEGEAEAPGPRSAESIRIETPQGVKRPPFRFNDADRALLDEVQQGAFWYMWDAADPATGLTRDRTSKPFSSVAAVGFALAALPVGVEREWITREQGRERALRILRALDESPRKAGLFYHFIDGSTAQLPEQVPEHCVSTIDSALLFAGMLVSSSYFGGDVAQLADRFVEEADWNFFVDDNAEKPHWRGFVSLGWNPADRSDPSGDGKLLPYFWIDSGDEQRLVTFLAAAAPRESHRIDPRKYYELRRMIGTDPAPGPSAEEICYFPWSGALFTNFFAHCFINYAELGADIPAALGVERRSRIDWWENSRRTALMHQRKCAENPKGFQTFGPNAWGLTASDYPKGYLVPGLFPEPLALEGAVPDFDFETEPSGAGTDKWGDGTIAPYGAGCAVMFTPDLSVAAMRHYRDLRKDDGTLWVWRDFVPVARRDRSLDAKPPADAVSGFGFQDAYNVDRDWTAEDCLGIDQGPLVLAIENARSGLVWDLFHKHPIVRQGLTRLKLHR